MAPETAHAAHSSYSTGHSLRREHSVLQTPSSLAAGVHCLGSLYPVPRHALLLVQCSQSASPHHGCRAVQLQPARQNADIIHSVSNSQNHGVDLVTVSLEDMPHYPVHEDAVNPRRYWYLPNEPSISVQGIPRFSLKLRLISQILII